MAKLLQEKKILFWLLILVLITTPLFGLLGGTPFLTFNFSELSNFLPSIYFIVAVTLIFWIFNIVLLLLAEKNILFSKILFRALISITLCVIVSTTIFYFFRISRQPTAVRIELANERGARVRLTEADIQKNERKFQVADSILKSMMPANIRPMPAPPRSFFFPQMVRSLTINLIILTLCELVFLYYRKQKVESENAKLKQTNLEARNNQLKMQLHPHFLFNSLNTLRLLLKKDPVKAEDYLLKLSEMLRFSTTSAMYDTVEVADELKLCLSYLQMQKVRFGDMLFFYIDEELNRVEGKLPVYSLQLLAENAIKHNSFTNEDPLRIVITYNWQEQEIMVKNRIQPKRMMEVTTKVGLKNLEERYQLLSNEGIAVEDNGQEFIVKIKIISPNQNTAAGHLASKAIS
ncbi:sensor histidine kinase [Ferruginibacter sp.]